jgi:hypothetical protein
VSIWGSAKPPRPSLRLFCTLACFEMGNKGRVSLIDTWRRDLTSYSDSIAIAPIKAPDVRVRGILSR